MMVKVKSDRGFKYEKELIDVICKDLTVKTDFSPITYKFTPMTDEQLVEKGLAKIVLMKQLNSSISTKTIERKSGAEYEIAVSDADAMPTKRTRKSIQKSFVGKMSQASKEQIIFYNEKQKYTLRLSERYLKAVERYNKEKSMSFAN